MKKGQVVVGFSFRNGCDIEIIAKVPRQLLAVSKLVFCKI